MALNNNSTPVQTPRQSAPTQPTQPQPKQQPMSNNSTPVTDLFGQVNFGSSNLFGLAIPQTSGSEIYVKLKEKMIELFKNSDRDFEFSILDLDKASEPDLAFSSMIIAGRVKNNPANGVAYHLLMLEATGKKLDPIYDNRNGTQIEVLRPTEKAIDDLLIKLANERVRRAFPNVPISMVDSTVLPDTFNMEDKNAVHQLAISVTLPVSQELLFRAPGFIDLNLATARNDRRLQIDQDFKKLQIENAVGLPQRSDVLVSFRTQRQQSDRNVSPNSGARENTISEVSGFIDLVWTREQGYNPYDVYQQQRLMQCYTPRMVITNIKSNFSYTPASILLALVSALTVGNNSAWVNAFRPVMNSTNSVNLHDIGAINIEGNMNREPGEWGKPIATNDSAFTLEALGQMVGALVHQRMAISLDCPIAGPQTWYTSVFNSAANSGPGSNASAIIIQAANTLTNGGFSTLFPANGSIFVCQPESVHLGYWTDNQGQRRDLRDFDYLAIANLSAHNPRNIREWSETFLNTSQDIEVRLARRKRMIASMTGETAVFTGFAERVTFSSVFLDALVRAVYGTGVPVSVNNNLNSADFNSQRSTAGYLQQAVMAPGQIFVQGAHQANNYGHIGHSYRWN